MKPTVGKMEVNKQQTIEWESNLVYSADVKNGELLDCGGMPTTEGDWYNALEDIEGFTQFLQAIKKSLVSTKGV